jgi:hypothetical protein
MRSDGWRETSLDTAVSWVPTRPGKMTEPRQQRHAVGAAAWRLSQFPLRRRESSPPDEFYGTIDDAQNCWQVSRRR